MVLDKNYKQLAGWSALPPDLLWDIEPNTGKNSTESDAVEETTEPPHEESNDRKEMVAKAHEDDILKVLEVFSQNNTEDVSTLEPKKKPKSWFRKSLSVIGRALLDSNQTQHVNQSQAPGKENSANHGKEEKTGFVVAAPETRDMDSLDDTEKERDHIEGTPMKDSLESSEEEATETQEPVRATEPMFLNITISEDPDEINDNDEEKDDDDDLKVKVDNIVSFVQETESAGQGKETGTRAHQALKDSTMKDRKVTEAVAATEPMFLNMTISEEPSEISDNDEEKDDGDELKAKVENIVSFVKETESSGQGKETCTRAHQALKDSTMKDRKVTEAVAAAVIIGAGILHALAGRMSPDIPDSDSIDLA